MISWELSPRPKGKRHRGGIMSKNCREVIKTATIRVFFARLTKLKSIFARIISMTIMDTAGIPKS